MPPIPKKKRRKAKLTPASNPTNGRWAVIVVDHTPCGFDYNVHPCVIRRTGISHEDLAMDIARDFKFRFPIHKVFVFEDER